VPLRRLEYQRSNHSGAYLTPSVALSGFLTLTAPCSPLNLPALFHAGNVPGVSPSELSPLEEPYRLSAAVALLMLTTNPSHHTTRPCHVKRAEARCSLSEHAPIASAWHRSRRLARRFGVPPPRVPPPAEAAGCPRGLATAGHPTSPGSAGHPKVAGCPWQGLASACPGTFHTAAPRARARDSSSFGSRTLRTVGLVPRLSPPVPKHLRPVTRNPAGPSTSTVRLPELPQAQGLPPPGHPNGSNPWATRRLALLPPPRRSATAAETSESIRRSL
jgi:hypothetical protein